MRKCFKITIIAVLIIIASLTAAFFYIKALEVPYVEVANVNLFDIQDGMYEGAFSEGPVSVSVSVKIKGSKIVEIKILEHKNALGKKAEKITEDIIENQSLDVDAISGATLSSNVIRRAIQEALSK
ncbi:MAG: FMN-binding protein [Alkaliphilus sp.]